MLGAHFTKCRFMTEILGRVVTAEPDWNRLPAETPGAIRRMLQRALKKDGRQRREALIRRLPRKPRPSVFVAGRTVQRPLRWFEQCLRKRRHLCGWPTSFSRRFGGRHDFQAIVEESPSSAAITYQPGVGRPFRFRRGVR